MKKSKSKKYYLISYFILFGEYISTFLVFIYGIINTLFNIFNNNFNFIVTIKIVLIIVLYIMIQKLKELLKAYYIEIMLAVEKKW